MHPVISRAIAQQAANHLSATDQALRPVIARHGLCTIAPHVDYYPELVRSIIGQQLSVKAAASIANRFTGLFDNQFPSPGQILSVSPESLREVGFSRAKALYVQDLARHVLDGRLSFDALDQQSNEHIIENLTAVKGIGEWTAHMFLVFAMGRTDVLPIGDLGVRTAAMKLYSLPALPSASELKAVAQEHQWHPYESIASWYLWQSLDNAPKVPTD